MKRFIFNLYFYTNLGGFLIIVSFMNLIHGSYIRNLIGYVLIVPTILFILYVSVNFNELSIKKSKFFMNYLPFAIFFSWIIFTAVLRSTHNANFNELFLYLALFSLIPYFIGLIISNKLNCINYRWSTFIYLTLLVLGLTSIIINWHEILFSRYRVTGFAEIGMNISSLILGVYALVLFNNIFSLRGFIVLKTLGAPLMLILVLGIIFFSGSMGNILSLFLTLIVFVFLRKRFSMAKTIIFISVIVFLAYIPIHYALSQRNLSQPLGAENMAKYVDTIDKIRRGDLSSIGGQRFYYIQKYLHQFYDNPITGKGFGSRQCLRCDPHNYLIELLGETGVISLLFFIPIMYYPLKSSYYIIRNPYSSSVHLLLSAMLLANFFESFFSGSIFINWIVWFLIGVMPFGLKGQYKRSFSANS